MRFLAAFILLFISFSSVSFAQSASQQECLLSTLKICAVHVVQDEAGILASPVRTRPKDLLWLVPFGVATGVALHYDAQAMSELGVNQQRQNRFETISNVGGIYAPLAASAAGYFIGDVRHNYLLRETSVLSAESMADATILNQGLKYAIDRQDPMQGDGTGRFWPHGPSTWPDGQSMPSEHAMNVWAFAHAVAARYPGWRVALVAYGLATTVSASRVMARQHFPSDVVVGSTLGYLIGGYVVHKRGEPSKSFTFSMVDTPNGRGMQLSYNFSH